MCAFPFGIFKKIGNRASTTPDTIAPVISDILTRAGQTKAIITWRTNEKADGKVYYSTTPVNLASASVILANKQGFGGKDSYVLIKGLATSTKYYVVIEAKDKAGNVARSSEFSFTTKSNGSIPPDVVPPVINAISTSVSTSTIDVSWSTNEVATSKVYYSTTTPVSASLSAFVQSGAFVLNHNLKIEGLASSTLYYLLIESTDTSANTATSSQFSTTTSS